MCRSSSVVCSGGGSGALALALALHSNQCVSLGKSLIRLALSLVICKVEKVNHVDSKRSFLVLSLMR